MAHAFSSSHRALVRLRPWRHREGTGTLTPLGMVVRFIVLLAFGIFLVCRCSGYCWLLPKPMFS